MPACPVQCFTCSFGLPSAPTFSLPHGSSCLGFCWTGIVTAFWHDSTRVWAGGVLQQPYTAFAACALCQALRARAFLLLV